MVLQKFIVAIVLSQ